MIKRYYVIITRYLTSRSYVRKVEKLLAFANIKKSVEEWLGLAFTLSLFFALSVTIGVSYYAEKLFGFTLISGLIFSIFCGIATFYIIQLICYYFLTSTVDRRAKRAEEHLPDALSLISSNIRAGLPAYAAISLSARPEFGPLEKEIKRVASKVSTGMDLENALLEMPKYLESEMIARTINLIVEGIRSGAKLAELLDGIADDIRTMKVMEREIATNVKMYMMFISFAALVGGPLLFGLSTSFVVMINNLLGQMGGAAPEVAQMGFLAIGGLGGAQINEAFLFKFALLCICITTVFASLIVGVLKEGKELRGVKYIPIFTSVAVLLFLAIRMFASRWLGGFV
jgi:pilus assembly protein TadC